VFPLAGTLPGTPATMKHSDADPVTSPGEVEGLRLLLAEREATIRDLRSRLDREAARLDAAAEERRRDAEERRRLQAMLTDRRPMWRRLRDWLRSSPPA
jgi:hypothetical protein